MAVFQEPLEAPYPDQLRDPDPEDRSAKYRVSNLVTRAVVGAIGFVLPFIFIFWEALILKGACRLGGRSARTITPPLVTSLWLRSVSSGFS